MKILFLVSTGPHAHDYGADFLYQGFSELLGNENVYDYPEKPCLHLKSLAERDSCTIDSDQCWPYKPNGKQIYDIIKDVDLVALAMSLDNPDACIIAQRVCQELVPRDVPIFALDMHDHVRPFREVYERIAGRALIAYFKRELPISADWDALPCPLSYPRDRVPHVKINRGHRVVYHATTHGGSGPGIPRQEIVAALRTRFMATDLDIGLYPSQENRPTPEELHKKMAQGTIGIAWNGAPNWDNNRFWENFAFGLLNISERPKIQIPHAPQHMRHVFYAGNTEDVVSGVQMFLQYPGMTKKIATEGHKHFLKYHTSVARAKYILKQIGEGDVGL